MLLFFVSSLYVCLIVLLIQQQPVSISCDLVLKLYYAPCLALFIVSWRYCIRPDRFTVDSQSFRSVLFCSWIMIPSNFSTTLLMSLFCTWISKSAVFIRCLEKTVHAETREYVLTIYMLGRNVLYNDSNYSINDLCCRLTFVSNAILECQKPLEAPDTMTLSTV